MSRIGLFTYSTRPRGSVVHAACLAEALTRAKHDVTLFALNRGEQGFFRELSCDVKLFPAAEAAPELDALIEQRIGEFLRGLDAANPELELLHAQDCLAANALLRARSSKRSTWCTVLSSGLCARASLPEERVSAGVPTPLHPGGGPTPVGERGDLPGGTRGVRSGK